MICSSVRANGEVVFGRCRTKTKEACICKKLICRAICRRADSHLDLAPLILRVPGARGEEQHIGRAHDSLFVLAQCDLAERFAILHNLHDAALPLLQLVQGAIGMVGRVVWLGNFSKRGCTS